jgi:heat shock protein HslJ
VRRRFAHALALGLAAAALTACGPIRIADAGALEKTSWRAIEIDRKPVDPATAPNFTVADGQAKGFSGCNGFSAAAQMWGVQVAFGAVTRTERICTVAQMRLEQDFLVALTRSERGAIRGDRLVLRDRAGDVRLRLAREPSPMGG